MQQPPLRFWWNKQNGFGNNSFARIADCSHGILRIWNNNYTVEFDAELNFTTSYQTFGSYLLLREYNNSRQVNIVNHTVLTNCHPKFQQEPLTELGEDEYELLQSNLYLQHNKAILVQPENSTLTKHCFFRWYHFTTHFSMDKLARQNATANRTYSPNVQVVDNVGLLVTNLCGRFLLLHRCNLHSINYDNMYHYKVACLPQKSNRKKREIGDEPRNIYHSRNFPNIIVTFTFNASAEQNITLNPRCYAEGALRKFFWYKQNKPGGNSFYQVSDFSRNIINNRMRGYHGHYNGSLDFCAKNTSFGSYTLLRELNNNPLVFIENHTSLFADFQNVSNYGELLGKSFLLIQPTNVSQRTSFYWFRFKNSYSMEKLARQNFTFSKTYSPVTTVVSKGLLVYELCGNFMLLIRRHPPAWSKTVLRDRMFHYFINCTIGRPLNIQFPVNSSDPNDNVFEENEYFDDDHTDPNDHFEPHTLLPFQQTIFTPHTQPQRTHVYLLVVLVIILCIIIIIQYFWFCRSDKKFYTTVLPKDML